MKASVAEVGDGSYKHYFGGDRWRALSPAKSDPPAVLLITLDLRDPAIGLTSRIGIVPLCSRIDYETPVIQRYDFDEVTGEVRYLGDAWHVPMDPDDLLPIPLKESRLRLRPTKPTEELGGESDPIDTFLGGDAFIRVRGEPLWLLDPLKPRCECGSLMEYLACIGYEKYNRPSGIVTKTTPFFIGELALYYFLCSQCNTVQVIMQA